MDFKNTNKTLLLRAKEAILGRGEEKTNEAVAREYIALGGDPAFITGRREKAVKPKRAKKRK